MDEELKIVAEASRLIGFELGNAVIIRKGERNLVIKAQAVGSSAAVVIKAACGPNHLLANECAALEQVNRMAQVKSSVPRLLGSDVSAGMVVMEAVEGAIPLDDLLNGTDPRSAARALLDTARALGRLHGATAQTAEAQDGECALQQSVSFAKLEPAIREVFELAGVAWSAEAKIEYKSVVDRLAQPGAALAFTVGDMAPSNILVKGREVVFIDFEYAGYRHAFYDAVFWRCICPFPEKLADGIDETYREGWAEMGRPWANECFVENLTLLAGHRALWSLTWGVKDLWRQDREMVPGVGARKVVRNWLRGFYRLAGRSRVLPALAEATERLDHVMGGLWPESAGEMSFPVFERVPTGGDGK